MEDLRALLKVAVEEGFPEQQKDQANSLVDAVCDALDAGGAEDAIRAAVAAEVNASLAEIESILLSAETMMRGGS